MQLRSSSTRTSRVGVDPDVLRLDALKKEYKIACSHDAQWAMMYFLEDHTHEIREILVRLNTKYKDSILYPFTFPGISEVQEEEEGEGDV